ncbi:type VII secretion integral membrane protein EccD [Oryzihumus sp.]|uniref:type VII secretion integral membrane protein EccD n=1 Tax=Oryzihumus sp. TaxID=1968903 RepID=UPI002ED7ED4B
MTQTSTAATTLIRLSVTAGTRRADLGLPGGIPVAEIIPELARELGLLDLDAISQGFRLVRHDGIPVEPDRSLAAQGVEDGFVLALEPAGDAVETKVYDDVVEAVADLVESQFAPWTAENSARTALGASVVFFLAGAVALFTARGHGALVIALGAVVAVLLVVVAAVLAHTRDQHVPAAALAVVATAYAAVAGFAVSTHGTVWARPLLYAGAAMCVAGIAGAVAVTQYRSMVGASAAVGLALGVVGALTAFTGWAVAGICAVMLAVAVITSNLLPWLAVSSSRLSTHSARTEAEIYADAPRVERAAVRRQVRLGHQLLLALSMATGLVALVCAPQAASGGVLGTVLGATAFAAVLLRTRHSRTRSSVLVAMVVGVLGLAVVGVSAALTHPSWRPFMGVALAGAAAVVVALALLAPRSRVGLGRVADALDGACLVALLPLSLAAAGVF